MKKSLKKSVGFKLFVSLVSLFIAVIIHSCRKDGKSNSQFAPAIIDAKNWYESAYPVNNSTNGKLINQSVGGSFDLSQLIKPDWRHSVTYTSDNKNVIEMPVDPAAKFISTFKIGGKTLNKAYSRSYYLLMNDGKKYEAYILTIVADSAYVKNDLSKLEHNTYRKQDTDFSGLALYFTPKGNYLGGYAYKDGQLVTSGTTTQQTQGQHIQDINDDNLKPNQMVINCVDWYQQGIVTNPDGSITTTGPWVYIGTTCTSYDDGNSSGGDSNGTGSGTGGSAHPPGGGSSSPATTPPPCPAGSSSGSQVTPPCIPSAPLEDAEPINNRKLIVDYMPLPSQTNCSINVPAAPCSANITNDLTGCNKNVVNQLTNKDLSGQIRDILQNDFNANDKVNLHFIESTNTGGKPAGTVVTKTSTAVNVEIRVNTSVLPADASQDYKASIIIHEIIHGYLNYKGIDENNQLKQHMDIAHSYINSIVAILQQAFGTDLEDAKALAFGGLSDFATKYSTEYNKLLSDNSLTEGKRSSDTEFERAGITGKPCS